MPNDITDGILEQVRPILANSLSELDVENKILVLNEIRKELHKYSPFKNEPVDCVQWVTADSVIANDYNPNKVAPPEMRLLETSILDDGYTQPIVAWAADNHYEVVDGFHRHRVGKENKEIRDRLQMYLPVAIIKSDRSDRGDRIASTIRHNRARGKHTVDGMSDIVLELKNRNWTDQRIAKKLGMDEDEILRLCQITGLAGLFENQEFSLAWDIEDSQPDLFQVSEDDFESVEGQTFRTVNTSDPSRTFHTFDKWECYKAGLYATTFDGMNREQCEEAYRDFLGDSSKFMEALGCVVSEWKHSCEHYLTNGALNRIAWLGQASMCYATGIPATFRGGYNLLSHEQQAEANGIALEYLNRWLTENGRDQVSLEEAVSDNQMDLY